MHDQSSRLQQWPHHTAVGHITLLIEHAPSLGGLRRLHLLLAKRSRGCSVGKLQNITSAPRLFSVGYGVGRNVRTECSMRLHTQSSSLMPIEGIDIFSTTLPATLMHMLVSSMRKKPMICSIIILVPCSALWPRVVQQWDINSYPWPQESSLESRGIFSLCAIAPALEVDTARNVGLKNYTSKC